MNTLGNWLLGAITLAVILVCAYFDLSGIGAGIVLSVFATAMVISGFFDKTYDNRKVLNWPKGFSVEELYTLLQRTHFESFNQVTYEAVEGLKEKAIAIRSKETEEYFVVYKEDSSHLVIHVLSPAKDAKAGNKVQLSLPRQTTLEDNTEKVYELLQSYLENQILKTKA